MDTFFVCCTCSFKACIWPAIRVGKSLLYTHLKTERKWESIKYMFSSQQTKVAVLFLDKNIIHMLTKTILHHHRKILSFPCSILGKICNAIEKEAIILLLFFHVAMAWSVMVTSCFKSILCSIPGANNQL